MKNLLTASEFEVATPEVRSLHWAAKAAERAVAELQDYLSPKLWSRADRLVRADLTADDERPLRAHVAAMAAELELAARVPESWEHSRSVGGPSPRAELGRRLGKTSRLWRG